MNTEAIDIDYTKWFLSQNYKGGRVLYVSLSSHLKKEAKIFPKLYGLRNQDHGIGPKYKSSIYIYMCVCVCVCVLISTRTQFDEGVPWIQQRR